MSENATQVLVICITVASMACCTMITHSATEGTNTERLKANAGIQKICVEKGLKYRTDWSGNGLCN